MNAIWKTPAGIESAGTWGPARRFVLMPSSVIKAAYYRPDEAVLDILFTTGRRYLYRDVPPDEADRFAAASSKGRYFNAHIRDHYGFTEIASAPI